MGFSLFVTFYFFVQAFMPLYRVCAVSLGYGSFMSVLLWLKPNHWLFTLVERAPRKIKTPLNVASLKTPCGVEPCKSG